MDVETIRVTAYLPPAPRPRLPHGNPRYVEERWIHTWRWRCHDCGRTSFCTFLTPTDADRYGRKHRCLKPLT